MAAIELRGVSKSFHGGAVVRDVSLSIRDGEFFILVGPSGCGKSTLLNLIVGLETPDAGEIRLDGRRVNEVDPRARNMAMVFQSYALYPHLTVRENLAFPLTLAKLSAGEIARRVAQAAELLELGELLERKPAALSGGQRQRVAMGRAIVREPAAFLLDEPLSNLDAQLRAQMRAEIARLQRRLGTTTVYVTHDQTEAMTLGDRIALMRRGEVQQVGTPRELYARPRNLFVAGFIGAPAMNFLPARRRGDRLETPLGDFPAPRHAAPGETLVVGFRPEDLAVGGDTDGVRIAVQADVVEWLGADLFVRAEVPSGAFADVAVPPELKTARGFPLVARLDPNARVQIGDRVSLRLDPARVHVFDASSGMNLAPETA